MQTPVVVFDLDETLVHSAETPLRGEQFVPPVLLRLGSGSVLNMYVRNNARSLLRQMLALQRLGYAKVGVWTAGTAEYAHAVLKALLGPSRKELSFVKTRADCTNVGTRGNPRYVKNLSISWPPSSNVIIYDDNRDTIALNRRLGFTANLVYPYFGERSDRELCAVHRSIGRSLRFQATPNSDARRQQKEPRGTHKPFAPSPDKMPRIVR